jgi:hypothetical protein
VFSIPSCLRLVIEMELRISFSYNTVPLIQIISVCNLFCISFAICSQKAAQIHLFSLLFALQPDAVPISQISHIKLVGQTIYFQ